MYNDNQQANSLLDRQTHRMRRVTKGLDPTYEGVHIDGDSYEQRQLEAKVVCPAARRVRVEDAIAVRQPTYSRQRDRKNDRFTHAQIESE